MEAFRLVCSRLHPALAGRVALSSFSRTVQPSRWFAETCAYNSTLAPLGCSILRNHSLPALICISQRSYAKGKDKKKNLKGKKTVEISEEEVSTVINLESMKNQMNKAVDNLKEDFIKNLSLRSSAGSIESLPVSLDGTQYTLQELAQIVRKDPKTVVVNMATFPQAIQAVLDAIQNSGMNLNPQQDGTKLFIPVPKVTKEHRENLAKNAKVLFVKCRVSIKDEQNKYVKKVKTNTDISKDLSFSIQNQIVAIADQYIVIAEKILDAKQTELLGQA